MPITVKLHASFCIGRFKSAERPCPAGTTLRSVAEELGLPLRDIGIVLRNGVHARLDDPLTEGDTIAFLPRIGGG